MIEMFPKHLFSPKLSCLPNVEPRCGSWINYRAQKSILGAIYIHRHPQWIESHYFLKADISSDHSEPVSADLMFS